MSENKGRPAVKLDFSQFEPENDVREAPKLSKEEVEEIAKKSGFTSRDVGSAAKAVKPSPAPTSARVQSSAAGGGEDAQPIRRGRKPTTKRNTPFSVRLKLETNNAIYRLAEEMESTAIAEVIELALDALQREIRAGKDPRSLKSR